MADKVEAHPKMAQMGNRIRMLRETLGMTQAQLAQLCQLSQGALSAYERNKVSGIPLASVMRLADALQTTIQWLAYGEAVPDRIAGRYRRPKPE